MEKKIIQLLKTNQDISLTAMVGQIEGAKGEYDYYFPAKDIEMTNILLVSGVSEEFIRVMTALISSGILTFTIATLFHISFDGGIMYNLPIATKVKHETPHWLPLLIQKGNKFPN